MLSGLGKALVQAFLDAGARKIYVGSRTLVETSDPRLQPIKLDVTNEQDIATAAEAAQDVTILINNAGITSYTSLLAAPSTQKETGNACSTSPVSSKIYSSNAE